MLFLFFFKKTKATKCDSSEYLEDYVCRNRVSIVMRGARQHEVLDLYRAIVGP